ncbi:MAG: hypothetical protein ABFR53_04175 [Actinomycetota bacterium]
MDDVARGEAALVESGGYVAQLGDRTLHLTITDPVTLYNTKGQIMLGPEEPGEPFAELVVLGEFIGVIPVERSGEHPPHDLLIPEYMVPVPDDFGAYLSSLDPLVVEGEGEYSGDGSTGVYWDLSIDTALGQTYECPFGQCVATLVDEFLGPYMVGTERRFRIVRFSGDGEGVFGFIQSTPEELDDTLALADMLLSGLDFEPTG